MNALHVLFLAPVVILLHLARFMSGGKRVAMPYWIGLIISVSTWIALGVALWRWH